MKPLFLILVLIPGMAAAEENFQLTTVEQLRELTPDQADEQRSIQLQGIVTYVEKDYNMLYVQDETGGAYISRPFEIKNVNSENKFLQQGDLVELSGVTTRGKFIPHVAPGEFSVKIQIQGKVELPRLIRPSNEGIFNPRLHNQWVEVDAFVTDVRMTNRWIRFSLVVGGKRLHALVIRSKKEKHIGDLVGSDVRIQGVYGAAFNQRREMLGANLLLQSIHQIELLDKKLSKAFSQSVVNIADIRQFRPGSLDRVHVQGVVTWTDKSKGFYLSDEHQGIWIELASQQAPMVGATLTVVGLPLLERNRMKLTGAVFQPNESLCIKSTAPKRVSFDEALPKELHGQLVEVEGRVIDQVRLSQPGLLVIKNGKHTFEATLPIGMDQSSYPAISSWVQMKGVYEMSVADQGLFRLLLRSEQDINIVKKPSWWTVERLTWFVGGLLILVTLALTWILTLRRQVMTQSNVIAKQIETQRLAEERSRIGQELHDTLEQHLTGIAMQIETACSLIPKSIEKATTVLQSTVAMLSHTRQEARRSVWGLKHPILESEGLAAAVRNLIATMNTEQTDFRLQVSDSFPQLSGTTGLHLLRITQEAIANSLKHANPSKIEIGLIQCSDSLELTIRDNGNGFDPMQQSRDGKIHFGIEGMRERVGKLNGTFAIDSQFDQGTTITIRLPTP